MEISILMLFLALIWDIHFINKEKKKENLILFPEVNKPLIRLMIN